MALDDLLRELTRRAETEIAETLANARTTADAIRAGAEAQCAARATTDHDTHAQTAGAIMERAVAEAVRAGRRGELDARARARDRVFTAVRARLAEVGRSEAYRAILPARLAEAIAAIGDSPAEIRCAPALVGVMIPLVADHPTLHVVADADVVAGFHIAAADGRVDVDETLDHRLDGEAAALSLVAMRALEAAR